eukprot:jgi/Undpi1/11575/HiC_scaffold_30.g13871.m1
MPAMPRRTLALSATIVAAAAFYLPAADAACSNEALELQWADSSNRIYVNAGCATISDIIDFRSDNLGQKGPIYHFNKDTNTFSSVYTGTYYMTANIHITNGATLEIDGNDTAEQGGCKTLLLASNSEITLTDSINIRAHGGNLVLRDTQVFSWDVTTGDYDMNTDDGRAYLSAVTEFLTGRDIDTCPGDTSAGEEGYSTGQALNNMGIARMDIYDSEVAYLGYSASESYGVSYKARGLCKTLENLDIFDDTQDFDYAVYGDILNSELHHNWFGHYSYGHQGGKWNYNVVHDNHGYGFDPHDDSDHLQIIGNEVYNNTKNGIMLHRSCDRAEVYGNYVYNNGDAGLSLYESSDCLVYSNRFFQNPRGVRWSNGANRNRVYENKIKIIEGGDYALYMYRGNDEPQADGNVDGNPINNKIYKNKIWSEVPEVLRMKYSDTNGFWQNTIKSGSLATFELCSNNKMMANNVFPDGFEFKVDDSCFHEKTDVIELQGDICA